MPQPLDGESWLQFTASSLMGLNALSIGLLGYLKYIVSLEPPSTPLELETKIKTTVASFDKATLKTVYKNKENLYALY